MKRKTQEWIQEVWMKEWKGLKCIWLPEKREKGQKSIKRENSWEYSMNKVKKMPCLLNKINANIDIV